MYRIRFNKNNFRDPHWVTTIIRWSDGEIKEANISSSNFWKAKKLSTATSLLDDLKVYAQVRGHKPEAYEIEEFPE